MVRFLAVAVFMAAFGDTAASCSTPAPPLRDGRAELAFEIAASRYFDDVSRYFRCAEAEARAVEDVFERRLEVELALVRQALDAERRAALRGIEADRLMVEREAQRLIDAMTTPR